MESQDFFACLVKKLRGKILCQIWGKDLRKSLLYFSRKLSDKNFFQISYINWSKLIKIHQNKIIKKRGISLGLSRDSLEFTGGYENARIRLAIVCLKPLGHLSINKILSSFHPTPLFYTKGKKTKLSNLFRF